MLIVGHLLPLHPRQEGTASTEASGALSAQHSISHKGKRFLPALLLQCPSALTTRHPSQGSSSRLAIKTPLRLKKEAVPLFLGAYITFSNAPRSFLRLLALIPGAFLTGVRGRTGIKIPARLPDDLPFFATLDRPPPLQKKGHPATYAVLMASVDTSVRGSIPDWRTLLSIHLLTALLGFFSSYSLSLFFL